MATQKNNNMQRSGNTQRKTSGSSAGGRNTKSSGGRQTVPRRSTGAGRGSSGKKQKGGVGSDKLLNLFLVLLLITIIVLAVLYFKKGSDEPDEPNEPVPTGQPQPGGVTAGPGEVTVPPEGTVPAPTVTLPPTNAPTSALPSEAPDEPAEPTAPAPTEDGQEPSEAPSPTTEAVNPPSSGIGTAEADEILADVFWEAGYRFTLSDSKFEMDGASYYRYDVSYAGKAQDYDMLVDRVDGELYYYEDGTRREFDGLPEHAGQPEDGGGDLEMTADAAAELLGRFSHISLGLPAKLDECSLMIDNWKTVVYGRECFCLNVFYGGSLAGSIYFTETADHVYYLDEFGEFVEVR